MTLTPPDCFSRGWEEAEGPHFSLHTIYPPTGQSAPLCPAFCGSFTPNLQSASRQQATPSSSFPYPCLLKSGAQLLILQKAIFLFFPLLFVSRKGTPALSSAFHVPGITLLGQVCSPNTSPLGFFFWGVHQTKKATKTKEKILNKTKQETDKKGSFATALCFHGQAREGAMPAPGRARPRRARCERRRRRISPGQANCRRATQRADGACSHANQKV